MAFRKALVGRECLSFSDILTWQALGLIIYEDAFVKWEGPTSAAEDKEWNFLVNTNSISIPKQIMLNFFETNRDFLDQISNLDKHMIENKIF